MITKKDSSKFFKSPTIIIIEFLKNKVFTDSILSLLNNTNTMR